MKSNLIDIFEIERTCEYRGETYRVRDNGSIYRERKADKRKRPLDEIWSFGKLNIQKGYYNFSSDAVHRIVATAFHRNQPSEKHIVDHIDTNKQNNRPENLRWLTRLENILLNPITLSRIIFKYGSIDNFLSDPSKPSSGILEQNFNWMRSVTKEESESTKNNLLNWAKEGKLSNKGELGEWVFTKLNHKEKSNTEQNSFNQSLTPNVIQKNWKTQSEFPKCPNLSDGNSLYQFSFVMPHIFRKLHYGKKGIFRH